MTTSWNFERVVGPLGGTTEGPVWDGKALLFTHVPSSHIMRYDIESGACTEFGTETQRTNGLLIDSRGRLFGARAGR